MALFKARPSHSSSESTCTVLLGVSAEGISVRRTADLSVLELYNFGQLLRWSVNKFDVVLTTQHKEIEGGCLDENKLTFCLDPTAANNSAEDLCDLLTDYSRWLVARRKRQQR